MRVSLAYSTCPNDTFIFHAMTHQLVECEGLSFDITYSDIEELNQMAMEERYDICKMSYSTYFRVSDLYSILPVGSALGWGSGPLLVAAEGSPLFKTGEIDWEFLQQGRVLIPGEHTTAALLLKLLVPPFKETIPALFSTIERRLLNGEAEAGVLIHEGRFTYQERGVRLIADLGELWERRSGVPVPLGGVAVRRSLGEELFKKVERVLRRSILFAQANRERSKEYIKGLAQEMREEVIEQHIEMFVNRFTLELGSEGIAALEMLAQEVRVSSEG